MSYCSCLKKRFATEIRDRHRAKRCIHLFALSINDHEGNLEDCIASDFDLFEEVMKKNGVLHKNKTQLYMSKSSNQQRKILNLLVFGYKPKEIREKINITVKKYTDNLKYYIEEAGKLEIRRCTYTLGQYLKEMKDEKIRTDQECQRLSGQWNTNMMNELIATVLTNAYIPPIILGEEITDNITKRWIIDGLQRSSTLSMFRYGNIKMTKSIDEPIVTYQRRITDENKTIMRDACGEIMWENVDYDIRNKTYEQLPRELQERFNEYQLETAIHQNCNMEEISKLVRRYNNHKSMNQAQRAFTYIDVFAKEIRKITENRFFKDVYKGSGKDRINGSFERLVGDMVILCYYPEQYRKDSKSCFKWLNENAAKCDFKNLDMLLTKLLQSIEIKDEVRELFNRKSAYIFVAAFKSFTELKRDNEEFGKFIHWFILEGKYTKINEVSWIDLDLDRSTRDSSVVHKKLNYLVDLIKQYFAAIQK